MRKLPLYPTAPRPAIALETPRARDTACARCELGASAKLVCVSSFGTGPRLTPGSTVVVLPAPLVKEDRPGGRPVFGEGGAFLQRHIGTDAPVMWTFAVRCAVPGSPGGPEKKDPRVKAALKGCRGYLAEELLRVRPKRVIAVGDIAAAAIFDDEAPRPRVVRRAYGWLGRATETAIPVFLLDDPLDAVRISTLRPDYIADIQWALTAQPPRPRWADHYHEVETPEDAAEAARVLRAAMATAGEDDALVFDVETTSTVGLWAADFRIVSLAFTPSTDPSVSYVWRGDALERPEVRSAALDLLADADLPKGGQNVKYDADAVLAAFGVFVRNIRADTRLLSRLIDPDMDADLDTLNWSVGLGGAKHEAKHHVDKAVKAINRAKKAEDAATRAGQLDLFGGAQKPVVPVDGTSAKALAYGMLPGVVLGRYNARDTVGTALNVRRLAARMQTQDPYILGGAHVWRALVRDATEVFSRVEARGFPCDRGRLLEVAARCGERIAEERAKIKHLAPDLNPDAPEQIADLLYRKMGLITTVKTEGGALSTAREALAENLTAHPIVAPIMRYGELSHLRNTYLDGEPAPGEKYGTRGMLRHIRPDGRVHCTYNLDGARCLPAGELVLTDRGYIPAETVKVGDFVLTHRGRARRVVETSVHAPAPIVRVTLSNGLSLRTTAHHGYYTGDGWVPAGDLRVGATVRVHGRPEEWRPVPGYPQHEVSSWGRTRDAATGVLHVTPTRASAVRRFGGDGVVVARAVAEAFHSRPPSPQSVVVRRNGVTWDVTADNLTWGTQADVAEALARIGATPRRYGSANPKTRLSDADVAAIRATPRCPRGGHVVAYTGPGVSARVLAVRYGVDPDTIRAIRDGRRRRGPAPVPPEAAGDLFGSANVVSVEWLPPEVTYGATVDEDESHVTGGVVTHNTGRLSASDPNLQNIPRAEEGKDNPDSIFGKLIKDLFYAPPGWVWLQLDYSQLELRVAALLSQDPVMLEIFASGVDYHMRTAELIAPVAFGVAPAQWAAMSEKERKPFRSKSKCFHPDTEVLTPTRGWARIVDLAPGEMVAQAIPEPHGRVRLEWVVPLEVFTQTNEHGYLVHLRNEGMDLRVTPDHRMLVYRATGEPAVVMPEAVERAREWANAGTLGGTREVPETLLRLAVATQADGSYTRSGIRWGFTKERKIARLRELLAAAGLPFSETVSGRVTRFYLSADHAPAVRALLDPDKTLPWWWLELTPALREAALDEARHWDSCAMPNWRMYRYSSVIRKNLDVLQALAAVTGRKTRLVLPQPGTSDPAGGLTIRDKATTRGGSLATTRTDHPGDVACLSVPSSFVLVRDGAAKVPVITGQSVNFGLLYGMAVKTLAKRMGCDVETADRTVKAVLGKMSVLHDWLEDRKTEARTTGRIRSSWQGKPGRYRELHRMEFRDNVAVNSPIQGGSSEFCLASVIAIERALEYDGLARDAEVIGTVHDSILILAREPVALEVAAIAKTIMEGHTPGAPIVLEADAEWGDRWGSLEKLEVVL